MAFEPRLSILNTHSCRNVPWTEQRLWKLVRTDSLIYVFITKIQIFKFHILFKIAKNRSIWHKRINAMFDFRLIKVMKLLFISCLVVSLLAVVVCHQRNRNSRRNSKSCFPRERYKYLFYSLKRCEQELDFCRSRIGKANKVHHGSLQNVINVSKISLSIKLLHAHLQYTCNISTKYCSIHKVISMPLAYEADTLYQHNYRARYQLMYIILHTHQQYKMSCVMRKPAFRICETKGADQLRSNCAADQRLCFRDIDI